MLKSVSKESLVGRVDRNGFAMTKSLVAIKIGDMFKMKTLINEKNIWRLGSWGSLLIAARFSSEINRKYGLAIELIYWVACVGALICINIVYEKIKSRQS